MPISVQLPDGSIGQFPDGMADADIEAVLQKQFAPEQDPLKGANTGIGRTILNQAEQGATFGLADEIQAGIGAGYAALSGVDGSLPELYTEALNSQRKDLAAQMKERPVLSVASNLGGALLTGGAAASTAPGKAALNWAGRGGTGARIAKGAVTGATSGAAYGFGSAEGGVDERLQGAKTGAIVGGAVGAVIPAVGAAYRSVKDSTREIIKSGRWTEPKYTADSVSKLANSAYKAADDAGGMLTPQVTSKFVKSLDDVTPQTTAGKMLAGDDPITKITENIKKLEGRPMSLAEAQEIDEFLGMKIDSLLDAGRVTKPAQKLITIQRGFRDIIDSAGPEDIVGGKEGFVALKEGRKLWSAAAKMRDVEKILTRASVSDNPATTIKSGFRTMLVNDKKLRGFSEVERKLIKQAAKTGSATDAMRIFGSRLIPIAGLATGNAPGAAAGWLLSETSRKAATAIQTGRANRVIESIAESAINPQAAITAAPKPGSITAILSGIGGGLASAVSRTPTETDIKLLRGNPKLAPQFDEVFGKGASTKLLKGKK